MEDWIASRKLDLKPSAWHGYRAYLDAYVLPIVGETPLQDLDTVRLNLLYVHLIERGRRKADRNGLMFAFYGAGLAAGREPTATTLATAGGVTYDTARKALMRDRRGQTPPVHNGGLAPKTVRNVHVMLRGALADAVRWNLLARNPAADARPPRVRRREHTIWSTDQLRMFVDHARSDPFAALWLLVCTTGLRRSELAGLRRPDLDLDRARVTSGDTRVVVAGRATDSDGKPKGSRRTLALDPVRVEALRGYLVAWTEQKRAFDHAGEHLFCHPDGRPIHPDTITDWFTRLSWQAGLPPIRLHDVRHSYATAALRAGVPVKVVSERLGHSSVSFTQDTRPRRLHAEDRRHVDLGRRTSGGVRRQVRCRRPRGFLDAFTVAGLREHLAVLDEEEAAFGRAYAPGGWLFVWPDGRRPHPDSVTDRFNRLVDAAGARRTRLHDVRHAYATLALNSGVEPKILSDRVGHSTPAVTFQIYAHRSTGLDRPAADLIGRMIEEAVKRSHDDVHSPG